jgi:hypothetical protein
MAHGCVADASLEGFHTKYYYMFWRPFHWRRDHRSATTVDNHSWR